MNKSTELLEKDVWDKYFAEALNGKGQEMDNSDLWWQISEDDTVDIIFDIFKQKNISILEAGCGSGGTNFSLEKRLNVEQIDLLDISENALLYAKKITPEHVLKKTRYIQGSILETNNKQLRKYDLVWNTGLIEHYQKDEIVKIIENMLALTKKDGAVVLGIPNIKSLAVLKSAFLGTNFAKNFLPFIKGYRNTTEIIYFDKEITEIVEKNFKTVAVQTKYAGSPLFVGTPKFIVKLFNKLCSKTRFSFLTYFILTRKDLL